MNGQVSGFRGALRTRWTVVLALFVVGAGAGTLSALRQAAVYEARASVLMPAQGIDSRGNPVRAKGAEEKVVTGRTVLDRAGRRLSPALAASGIRPRISVRSASEDVLEVRATGRSPADARLLADAVVDAYVAVSNDGSLSEADPAVADMRAQETDASHHIDQLNSQIAADAALLAVLPPDAADVAPLTAEHDRLVADATTTTRQLLDVEDRISAATLRASIRRQGTRVVQPAVGGLEPVSPRPLRTAGLGGAIGLVAGAAAAVAVERRRRGPGPVLHPGPSWAPGGPGTGIASGDWDTPLDPSAVAGGPGGHDSGRAVGIGGGGIGVRVMERTETSRPVPATGRAADVHSEDVGDAGPLVEVRPLVASIGRRRGLVVGITTAGMVVGLALSLLSPPVPAARVGLALAHPSGADPSRNIRTDVVLLGTRSVAEEASARLGATVTPDELLAASRGRAVSDEVLQVTVSGPSPDEAIRRAGAMSDAFLAFRDSQLTSQWDDLAAELNRRRQDVTTELSRVTQDIQERLLPGAGVVPRPADMGELETRQDVLRGELARLSQQIGQGDLDSRMVVAGSRVIEPADSVGESAAVAAARNMAAGMVAGLAAIAAWIAFRQPAWRRVRRSGPLEPEYLAGDSTGGPVDGPVGTTVDDRLVQRHLSVIWALLYFNVLSFFSYATMLIPISKAMGQALTMGTLATALVMALSLNRRLQIRPNLFLGQVTLLAVLALMASVRVVEGPGSVFRAVRLVEFVTVLWLLTPWWGRRDLLLVRCHLRAVLAVCAMVLLGLVLAPGKALSGGGAHRLVGVIWPIPAPQVAEYVALAVGMSLVLWMTGTMGRRAAFFVTGLGLAMIVATQTRTALVGLVAGTGCAALSLLLTRIRVRRAILATVVIVPLVLVPTLPLIIDWANRNQASSEIAGLTGRRQVWDGLLAQPRSELHQWFGTGLSDKSFNGLSIDNTWLAIYKDEGLVGDAIVAAMFGMLLVAVARRPSGPARAIAVFLLVYCLVASYTEVGVGDASPYLLSVTVAASLVAPGRRHRSAVAPA